MCCRASGCAESFHVTHRRQAEEILIFPVKVCSVVVPDSGCYAHSVESIAQHETAGFLKS